MAINQPYSPLPTVSPLNQGTPGLRVSAGPEAFGVEVARAIQGLGKTLEHAGDEVFVRAQALQQLDNEARAKEADTEFMIKAGELHAGYSELQGKAKADAYPKYVRDLQEARRAIRDTLPNDMARKMYDGQSLTTMGRSVFNGAGQAATAQRQYVAGASAAKVDALKENTAQSPDNENVFRENRSRVEKEIRETQAPLAGWSPEKTDEVVREQVSALTAQRIIGLSRLMPASAQEMLERERKNLTAADFDRADKVVLDAMRTTGARIIADEETGDLKKDPTGDGRSMQERINEGIRKAEAARPNDPTFKDYVINRIKQNVDASRSVQADNDRRNKNILDGRLIGTGGGPLPTTIEELTSTPEARAAWESINETQKKTYLTGLSRNARRDVGWTEDRMREALRLRGMASVDPKAFLEENVVDKDLPMAERRALGQLQIKMKEKAEGDPRVTHALSLLRPQTEAAGLNTVRDREGYYQFAGALQDALDFHQKTYGKPPSAKEVNEIGARLLQQTGSKLYWWGTDHFFKQPVPENIAARIKADPIWVERNLPPPDEKTIQRIYVREEYKKLFGKKQEEGPRPPVSR